MTGTECIEWSGSRFPEGYGQVTYAERRKYGTPLAHRVAWMKANGRTIPKGGKILHSCDNPPCVNPDHLSLGTQSRNILDAYGRGRMKGANKFNASKTHCARNHPYDEQNTLIDGRGHRACRTCHKENQARYTARKKGNLS